MRKVTLRVVFNVEKEYPDGWDDDMILFHVNESSSCRDNLLRDRLAQSDELNNQCTCFDPNEGVKIVKQ